MARMTARVPLLALLLWCAAVGGHTSSLKLARLPKHIAKHTTGPLTNSSAVRLVDISKASDEPVVDARVSYGQDATSGMFPYIGLTRLGFSGYTSSCASTLIAPRVALTAGALISRLSLRLTKLTPCIV